MRLIIAEKHSVGQAIAQAVGGHMEKHDGYVQVGDDLVTWAQGHLVDLAAPDEYKDHDWDRWSLDTLPIDPTPDWLCFVKFLWAVSAFLLVRLSGCF